ncbi:MAG: oxygenase MpaB family protein, partial [Flavobacteriales bacterium]
YVLRSTFGNTEAATRVIEQVKRVHSYINGTRADGVSYRALDPELIAWVHTCIPWAIMTAFDRYRRPLSRAEKDQYLKEQAPIGRMGGADWVPETVSELEDYVEHMRPLMAYNDQTRQFGDFLLGTSGDVATTRQQRFESWMGLHGSMLMMPDWARKMTGTYHSSVMERFILRPNEKVKSRLVRWAVGELPCLVVVGHQRTHALDIVLQFADSFRHPVGAAHAAYQCLFFEVLVLLGAAQRPTVTVERGHDGPRNARVYPGDKCRIQRPITHAVGARPVDVAVYALYLFYDAGSGLGIAKR